MSQNSFSCKGNAWIRHILTYFWTKKELLWHKKVRFRIPFDKSMFRLGAAGESSYVAGDG